MKKGFIENLRNQPYLGYSDCNILSRTKPRVVHLVEGFNDIGGPPVLVRQIINSPLAEKYEFHVISYAIKGINFKSLFFLVSLLTKLNPDIVHVHGLKLDGFYAALAARLAKVKQIITVIHSSTEYSVAPYVSPTSKIRRWLVCNLLETCTLLLSNSIYTVCDHIRDNTRIRVCAGTRLKETIHNCMHIPVVPETKEEIRQIFGFNEHDILIIFVGRICINKGLLVLADAMDKVLDSINSENIKLVLVGDGNDAEYKKIKDRFYSSNNNNIFFLGAQNNVFALYKMSDVFVLPSIVKENFSFSLLEATASGIPVVATDHGGNPELVLNLQTGILVPSENVAALSDAIKKLIYNKNLRVILGNAGKMHTRINFSVDKMLMKTSDLYEELLSSIRP